MKHVKLGVILLGIALIILGCEKPEEAQNLDLDTTYFPFGRGYEWCYERHREGFDSWEEWNYYDTSIVKVTDSFWTEDTLFFKIDGPGLYDIKYYVAGFLAKIYNGKIRVFGYPYPGDTIALIPAEQEKGEFPEEFFEVSYNEDTLYLYSSYDWGDIGISESGVSSSSRVRGIGVVKQILNWNDYDAAENNRSCRLLYFYNGQDTVYKAD
jgi:hypothetical protein